MIKSGRRSRTAGRFGVVAAGVVATVGLAATSALAFTGDNNGNGSIDRGDRGPAVVCVQQVLSYEGYNLGPSGVDGDFGGFTNSAVHSYQDNNSLGSDGQVGPITGGRMTADIRARRDFDRRTGETGDLALMVDWINRCVGHYANNSGQQIFH